MEVWREEEEERDLESWSEGWACGELVAREELERWESVGRELELELWWWEELERWESVGRELWPELEW